MARIIALDSDEHLATQSLLPWYASGTLEQAEALRVHAHLAECERCQADLQWQERLGKSEPPDRPGAGVDRDWAALRQRILADESRPLRRRGAVAEWLAARWLPLALGAQAGVVTVLLAALIWPLAPPRDDGFRALGAAPNAASANALIVFRPTASESEIRHTLRTHRALLVGGPTVTDAYLVRLPAPLSPEALSLLRADGAVLRLESLEGDAR